MAIECVDSRLKAKVHEILCKLDIEKAYRMSTSISYFIFWRAWVFGNDGAVGFRFVY